MSDPGGGGAGLRHRIGSSSHSTHPNTKDIGIQVNEVHRRGKCKSCLLLSVWTVFVVIGVLAVVPFWDLLAVWVQVALFGAELTVTPGMMDDLGMEGIILFKQHDRNSDGSLSLREFEPIAHRLLHTNDTSEYELPIRDTDEVLTIESFFTPLDLNTMSLAKDDRLYAEKGSLDPLYGLKYWKKPNKEWQNFAAAHLKHFLPTDPYLLEDVGETYFLIQSQMNGQLSSNRYVPPPLLLDQDVMIHRLLTMFHPQPFVYTRFAPQGSVAIVRALNKKYVDIMFRIHAEFQLNKPPFFPFWFTPAQFTGNIIISKDGTKVLSFHLYVPNEKRLNVDMEWLNEPHDKENMEVDIGHMDRMELKSTRSSLYVYDEGNDYTNTYLAPVEETDIKNIVWDKEITVKKAARELEVKMYPFKKVAYYNFTEAYHVARELQKPVHSILLWGALDDQSC